MKLLFATLIMLAWQAPVLTPRPHPIISSHGPIPLHKTYPALSSPDSILNEVAQKLNTLKRFEYEMTRELSYETDNYHNISTWRILYDFDTADTLTGFKYQVEDSTFKEIYNGAEKFHLDKKSRTMQVDDHPGKNSFQYLSFLYNSITTLRNILPLLINDPTVVKSVSDTTADGIPCTQITLNLGRRRIQNLGRGLDHMETKYNFIYKILVQKATGLPYKIIQLNDLNNDRITTTFTHPESDPKAPGDLSWYYSTYADIYRMAESKVSSSLIAVGSTAPSWKLESPANSSVISLDELKGQVVLLDFWIKNCGPCIQSVPHLNQLKEKFKDQPVRIISINAYDSKADIAWFCNKHNIQYTVLSNGREVAKEYGIDRFPTCIIIDKTGKVVYAQAGFDASVQAAMEEICTNQARLRPRLPAQTQQTPK